MRRPSHLLHLAACPGQEELIPADQSMPNPMPLRCPPATLNPMSPWVHWAFDACTARPNLPSTLVLVDPALPSTIMPSPSVHMKPALAQSDSPPHAESNNLHPHRTLNPSRFTRTLNPEPMYAHLR